MAMVLLFLPILGSGAVASESYYGTNHVLSAPAAGQPGSTAIHMASNAIVAWADGYTNMHYGAEVSEEWKTPEKALGPAEGTSFDIVSLGRGGQITLTFPHGIADGSGADFVIFENSFDDVFLELAHVEVSSDGMNYVRFPNYSYTPDPVGAFGSVFTELIYGLAGKYRQGYGTPFDLNELRTAYHSQLAGNTDFSPAFATALTNDFPLLDLGHITHVRLIDVVGDGSASDARGEVLYDPYPTIGSAGFDLDAVGVINPVKTTLAEWAATHSVPPDGQSDSDGDGASDLQEFVMGGDPNNPADIPSPTLAPFATEVFLFYTLDPGVAGTARILESPDLSTWSNAVPAQVLQQPQGDLLLIEAHFPADKPQRFFRLLFEGQ